MGRKHLFEFEDQPWFPREIRGYMQDHLTFMGNLSGPAYQAFVEKLKAAMERVRQTELLDLCSGSGGPARTVVRLLREQGLEARARLSDLFPNVTAYQRLAQETGGMLQGVDTPVDATNVPAELNGVRLIANGFHHFSPTQAHQVLADAVAKRQGIAVIEMVNRSVFAFIGVLIGTVMVFLAAPFLKPFRVSRLVLTYLVPLVPLFLLWDGIVSCLRVYSPDELRGLVSRLGDTNYEWDIGTTRVGPGVATYLIGTPRMSRGK
ncbi:MAG: class I SAM-dependent methyltransferase [Deltaproteobacteria bacterium]|nr:class I SAM-dependent methyltransferase [Deltaproteobacteria bacterium]